MPTEIVPPLKLSEFAALLGVSIYTAGEHCRNGRVPGAVQVLGGCWRIPLSAVPESLRPKPEAKETVRRRQKRDRLARERIAAMK
jgi:predicted site-specific integrase-resolvase